jgi:DNA mismatch repair protein MutL
MAVIKILPEDLINKIAAGEVVERPASVVKELLDNAFDARATHITVEIEEGGKSKIVVIDDGSGMDKEDALMAFKPHATSKLSSEEDLFKISKFGFRGEALSSIAAVSKCTLKTRKNDQNIGILVKIEGGDLVENTETGAPFGTSITVEDLFYNTPARKEFLKQTQSEYRAILDIVEAHALANPQVALTLVNDGKIIYNFPKDDELEDRARVILGKDTYQNLIGIFYEHPHLEIFGFIGKPEIASERAKNQFIFVNKRKINDKSIHAVIKNSYSTLLPKNLQPQYIIMIQVQPNIVDVNVHPRKEEVKFSNASLINEGVSQAVKKALERSNLTPGAKNESMANPNGDFGAMPRPFGQTTPPRPFGTGPLPPFGAPKPPFNNPFANPPRPPFGQQNATPGGFSANPFAPNPARPNPPTPSPKPIGLFNDKPWEDDTENDLDDMDLDNKPKPTIPNKKRSFFIIKDLYIVKETETGMVLYDQHAVHERINYEKLLALYEKGKNSGNTQKLLTPVIIELSAKDYSIMQENIDELNKTGFEIENFGNTTIKILEVPAIFANSDIKKLIHEFIADLESDNKVKDVDSENHKALTYLACRSSYKANDKIPDEEIEILLNKLETAQIKYTCPHGRPVKIELTFEELEKMFKRTGF